MYYTYVPIDGEMRKRIYIRRFHCSLCHNIEYMVIWRRTKKYLDINQKSHSMCSSFVAINLVIGLHLQYSTIYDVDDGLM